MEKVFGIGYTILTFVLGIFPLIVMDMGNTSWLVRFIIIFVLVTLMEKFVFVGLATQAGVWITVIVQCFKGIITGPVRIIAFVLFVILLILKISVFLPDSNEKD